MTQIILEFSGPRTGSSALRYMLLGSPNVIGLGEVFHSTDAWELRANPTTIYGTDAVDGERLKPEIAAHLGALRRSDPAAMLGELQKVAEAKGLGAIQLKIFPGHLTFRQIDEIMTRFSPVCYMMHRAPIEMYVSICKAKAVGAWGRVDTTDIKPELSPAAFRQWQKTQQTYFQVSRFLAERRGLDMAELSYEQVYQSGRPSIEVVQQFYTDLGVDLGDCAPVEGGLTKQDKTSEIAGKVSNWAAFEAGLKKLNAADRLWSFETHGQTAKMIKALVVERLLPEQRVHKAKLAIRRMIGKGPAPKPARSKQGN
ncbi:hypothetical protein DL237_07945 [Pseudooceanicola sediminis]|uniref:Sulfotransferase n=1 Tax=Pseudooceanicola sediminis TaxID=2211117 RepID=A0A399J374_9RHOB|nr:hypothetical protein [Pseudooceanicola sediminis]RII39087.1 hypothetical protein DL237_07945 [Pseudooceanicola sediminis]